MKINLTVIASDEPRRLTKHITLQNKELITEAGGYMTRGTYAVRQLETLEDFSEILASLRSNEALVYGVPKGAAAGVVVTKSALENMPEDKRQGHIARSNDCFEWSSGPGIFMIDIDPPKQGSALTKEDAIASVRSVAPELRNVPMLWFPSSSSYIFADDGSEQSGLRGQRLYVPVLDARKIPELADALWKRAWASGHGSILVSKAGQILKRTFFDKSVYQPSRLDFAAGASTGKGIIQKRGMPELVE
ncbi:hypothetical protein [Pacificibacter marinus]|uniref:Uncharacterized protein n=1 Tax=Pacificibacter marinus TaxID=658057 RepID=A0A1Y5T8L3_9RHOB|nr:hypothetical protein [Pacificibacter marinus]SEL00393.1 hypothetical protein SAMN04488032_109143 [Pacificibacter marinus]SLN54768.1 hypothetical protein PAM7971_02834 [Pacificibacter marinus]